MARQFGKKANQYNRYKFCERCLHGFRDSQSLERHANLCGLHKAVNITMPEKHTELKFTNWHKTMPVPIVIYADIEAITRKIHTSQPNPDNSYSLQKELQEPCAVGFVVKQQHSTDSYYSFEGKNCIQELFTWMRCNAKKIYETKRQKRVLKISKDSILKKQDQ